MKKSVLIFTLIVVAGISAVSAYVFVGKKFEKKEEAPTIKTRFSNGQEYAIYASDRFKIAYPAWEKIDTTNIAESDKIKIAVNKDGCSLFVKEKQLPKDYTLESYTEKVINDLGNRITVIKSEVKDGKAILDADIGMDTKVTMHNVSRVFQVGETIYSVAFVAEKSVFADSCGRISNEVIESVEVK